MAEKQLLAFEVGKKILVENQRFSSILAQEERDMVSDRRRALVAAACVSACDF